MNIREEQWKLHNIKERKLLINGLKTGKITPYDDELIEKLRTIYYGGIPASILLLSDGLSNGKKLIYDTSAGFIYDKELYWRMEHPKVRKENSKEAIMEFIKLDEEYYPENIERDKYASPLILPFIEMSYGRPNEMYSLLGIELLQREIEYFKKKINYDDVCKEIDEDMKKYGLK